MSGPQKPGDKYNYDVAAFLKTNAFEYSSGLILDLRKHSFNAAPNPFPPEATSFNQKISMDLIISTSDDEYLCECKSSDNPKNLSINSKEFKETLLEFIGLEDYKNKQTRIVRYLMITNMSITLLEKEISNLKENSKELLKFSSKLKNQAKNKWKKFDSEIKPKAILKTLDNLLIIKIEKGRLRQAERNALYQKELMDIIRRVERKDPKLVPLSLSKKAVLKLALENEENTFLEKRKLFYNVEINSKIIEQIIKFELTLQKVIVKATVNELPFLGKYKLTKRLDISNNQAGKFITESINDLIEEKLGSLRYMAIFFPTLSEIYFAKLDWASNIVEQHFSSSTRRYSLIKENELEMAIPPYVSIFLITETRRLVNGIIVDPSQIDQTIDDVQT